MAPQNAKALSDFYGPKLKIERAERHIEHLEAVFQIYVRENLKRMRHRSKRSFSKSRHSADRPTFPRHTPTILGDALHNLRASLDHAYYIACELNSATLGEFTSFPFGKDKVSLTAAIRGRVEKGTAPSDPVVNVILEQIQPYETGRLGLYGLHRLDITDKHKILIPTQQVMHIENLDFVDASGRKTGGGISGITLIRRGGSGEFFDFQDGGAKLQNNARDAFDISFQTGQPFEGQSILKTVRDLRNATAEALDLIINNV